MAFSLNFCRLGLVLLVTLSFVNETRAQQHGESNEEHFHRNEIAFVIANTYEAAEGENFFTLGAEYARLFTERFGVTGELEVLPDPNAWIFVVPFTFKVAGELGMFAGAGLEHLSRRTGSGGEEGEGGEHDENAEESGADNLFLFRVGAGYHIPLGARFFMTPHVALDFVKEEHEVAKALVYGVKVGFGF